MELTLNSMLYDRSTSTRDKLAVIQELRQILIDEIALQLHGSSYFLGDEFRRVMKMGSAAAISNFGSDRPNSESADDAVF
jgi:hypothetical protein